MSPVEMVGMPTAGETREANVPLPTPGGPKNAHLRRPSAPVSVAMPLALLPTTILTPAPTPCPVVATPDVAP